MKKKENEVRKHDEREGKGVKVEKKEYLKRLSVWGIPLCFTHAFMVSVITVIQKILIIRNINSRCT